MLLPRLAIILHTVGSSDQPAWTDDGRSTHVPKVFDVEADLPGELAILSILTADNTRRLEHAPPTLCTDNNQLGLLELVVLLRFTHVLSCNLKIWM